MLPFGRRPGLTTVTFEASTDAATPSSEAIQPPRIASPIFPPPTTRMRAPRSRAVTTRPLVAKRHALDLGQARDRRDGEDMIGNALDGCIENRSGPERKVEDALDKIRRRFRENENDDVAALEGFRHVLRLGISSGLQNSQRAPSRVSRCNRLGSLRSSLRSRSVSGLNGGGISRLGGRTRDLRTGSLLARIGTVGGRSEQGNRGPRSDDGKQLRKQRPCPRASSAEAATNQPSCARTNAT